MLQLLEGVPAMGRHPAALPFVLRALQSLCPPGESRTLCWPKASSCDQCTPHMWFCLTFDVAV